MSQSQSQVCEKKEGNKTVKLYTRHVSPVDMVNFRHAWKIDENHYRVYGRDGEPYILFVYWDSLGQVHIKCPCKAGVNDVVCFHATRVLMRLQREGYDG